MGLAARKISLGAERRIAEAALSLDGKRVIFIFEDGEGCSIPRRDLPNDDGTSITAIQIYDHRGAVSIAQSSGQIYDLPWDSIKHYGRGGRRKAVSVGARLKKLRAERGFKQEAFSRAAGISRMQLNRLESDISSPNLETLVKLARVLGISPKELVE